MLTDSGLDTYLRKHTAQEEQNLLGATNDYPGIETITTASGELCYCFTPTPAQYADGALGEQGSGQLPKFCSHQAGPL